MSCSFDYTLKFHLGANVKKKFYDHQVSNFNRQSHLNQVYIVPASALTGQQPQEVGAGDLPVHKQEFRNRIFTKLGCRENWGYLQVM